MTFQFCSHEFDEALTANGGLRREAFMGSIEGPLVPRSWPHCAADHAAQCTTRGYIIKKRLMECRTHIFCWVFSNNRCMRIEKLSRNGRVRQSAITLSKGRRGGGHFGKALHFSENVGCNDPLMEKGRRHLKGVKQSRAIEYVLGCNVDP